MSKSELPASLDVIKFADKESSIQGQVSVDSLRRVKGLVAEWLGPIQAELTFGRDSEGRIKARGRINAIAEVTCQRCLGLFDYTMACEVNTVVVFSDEQLRNLPRELEGYELPEGAELSVSDFVEEEILLNLPQIFFHEDDEICRKNLSQIGTCQLSDDEQVDADGEVASPLTKANPFAALSALKRDSSK